jgi:polysaccharide pyruvyl transferase WcaK-like protein
MKVLIISADRTEEGGYPRNIGDAFLTHRLARHIESLNHTVEVAELGYGGGPDSGVPRLSAGSIRALTRGIRAADLVIYGGGTLVQDDQPDRLFKGMPRLALAIGMICRTQRTPLRVIGVGVDSINRRRARAAFRVAFSRAGTVLVRDADSLDRVEALGLDARLGADVALLGGLHTSRSYDRRPSGLLLALNRSEVRDISVADLAALAKRFGSVRLVSMDQSANWDFVAMTDASIDGVKLVEPSMQWPQVEAMVERSVLVVGSRLHALYMALLHQVPCVAIQSSAKVDAFIGEFAVPSIEPSSIGSLQVPAKAHSARSASLLASSAERLRRELNFLINDAS